MLRTCHLINRIVSKCCHLLGKEKKKALSRVSAYAARAFGEEIPEEEECRQREESRKREQAEGVLSSARHAQQLGLLSETGASAPIESGHVDSQNTSRRMMDPIYRMCSVLLKVSHSNLKSHRLLGSTIKMNWHNVLRDLRHYGASMRSKSSGLFSLSTVGCALVGCAQLLKMDKARLPGIMQVVGESCKTGKGALEVGLVDTARTSYSVVRDLYLGAVNQSNKVCDSLQGNIDMATQTLQSIDDRRNQECSSILSGKG
ncbi:hypothetical protein [Candidatus Similichlamydia laticola]|uniref:Uncharacterized protein n=1 Tax=Candidatus Similichlamydia laticola TaxID=2170265 RepID=A0A369KI86_9BACT|nr:hypothetical protein [Candidatus Similichlamydia laticola]RDB31484.1 hypothetical protein HAT2_00410 [Candidatus Similichlamydia laticola]